LVKAMAANDTEQLVVELEARVAQFERNFKRANRTASDNWTAIENRSRLAARRVENSFNAAALRVGGSLKAMAGAFAGGFAIGGLSQLPQLVRQTVASTAEIADVADKIGVTTERLQELRFAADQSGVTANELDDAMAQFARRIGEAAAGSGDLAKILAANGVAIRDAEGNIRPLNDLLREYAELIRNAGSDSDRLALAVDAFGRSGDGMVNLLRDGTDGLDALTAQARTAGAVLGDDLVRAAADVDDKFAVLQARFDVFVKSSIIEFVGDVNTIMADLAGVGQAAADAWGRFEEIWNRIARISPEDAAKSKLRAELIRQAVTGDYGTDADYSLTFPQAPKGDRPGATSTPTIVPGARSGGGSRESAIDTIEREREKVDELIAALESERDLIGASEGEQRLAAELRRAGANATEEQRARIRELIPLIEAERAAHERAADRAAAVRDLGREGLGTLLHDLKDGASLADSLTRALDRLTDRLLDMALDGLFSAPAGGAVAGGGFLGWLAGLFGFADGGWTGGQRGKPRGIVHGEEFVVRAGPAARHRELLEAINAGVRVPALAGGPGVRAGGSITVAPTINVAVEGGSRGREADAALGKEIGAAVEDAVRATVIREIVRQKRPGGLLR
jgi:hypothetical protein